MADSLHLSVTTPERQLVDEQVPQVQIPSKAGYIGVLPEHAPLLGELGAGLLTYGPDGQGKTIAVAGGFIEVLNNEVRVLAERAALPNEIDVEKARQELQEAQAGSAKPEEGTDPNVYLERAAAAQAMIDAAQSGK